VEALKQEGARAELLEIDVSDPASIARAAKQLAARLFERLPVVVGGGQLAVAAYRWKTQFNENSKSWALFEEVPELGHNTIVGFGLPAAAVAQLHVVFLGHPSLSPRLLLHYDGTAEALRDAGVTSERVAALGTSALAQILTGAYHGDWVSFYLAIVNGVDPSPVGPIEKLKRHLAQG
jgi:glucose/mannose-6-phosphate isomerase